MHSRVIDKKETSKPDRGVVVFERQCIKQDGTIAQEMKTTLMYKRRPK
jgi:acyl dehydratase